ncbi:MAG: drug/metabolite transporter (DMT)-like permease [Flavobacteriales bacterium]|jgi:drug/metabolite transporter (DMT)-like permease
MSEKLQAHLALFAVALIYGANYVIAKGLMPEPIPPRAFILIRVCGALALFGLIRLRMREKVERKDFGRLILCGLTGVAVNQIMFFEGLNLTSPVNAAIIMTSNPILVMLLAGILLKNRITKKKMLGVLSGAIGAITLIYLSSTSGGQSSWIGDTFVLVNATSYAIYLVLVKPLMSKYKPITVITWIFLFGLVFVLPLGIVPFSAIDWANVTTEAWWKISFVVVATTFMAYLLNIFALKRVQPTVASSYIYLQPVVVTIFSWLLSAPGSSSLLEPKRLGCTLLIFLGVWLVSSNSQKLIAKN